MRILMVLLCFVGSSVFAGEKNWQWTLEGGAVFQTISDVEIPPGTGTRFSLVEAVGKGPLPFARMEGRYALGERHRLRFLVAPLVIEAQGQLDKDVIYNGETFLANTDTTYRYQFNSYRLGYAWRFASSEQWAWDVGFTGKIRHAEIALTQGGTKSGYPNIGFVPLLHVAGEWRLNQQWQLQLDMDGLASPYGRALDLGLYLHRQLNDVWSVGGGYRTVEGGADVDVVYNFAWLHYAGLRVQARL